MFGLTHFQEKVIKFIFEGIVVLCCLVLSHFTHSKILDIADVVLLIFLCVTLTANIMNVLRHKVHYDKVTTKRETVAAEVAIVGLILLMMGLSLSHSWFGVELMVTPKLTDIVLYSVLALRDGIFLYLTLAGRCVDKKEKKAEQEQTEAMV